MGRYQWIIAGRLPGLNEYINAERKSKQAAARLKKQTEEIIADFAVVQLGMKPFAAPVRMHYTWVEANRRRDKDNIAFAKKFIQDALVKAGLLANDGWDQIAGFTDSFALDSENPRVEIVIEEVDVREQERGA